MRNAIVALCAAEVAVFLAMANNFARVSESMSFMPNTSSNLRNNSSRKASVLESLVLMALDMALAPSNINSVLPKARPNSSNAIPLRGSDGLFVKRSRSKRSPCVACMESETRCASTKASCPFCKDTLAPACRGHSPSARPEAGSSSITLVASGTASSGWPLKSTPNAHSPRTGILSRN